MTLIHVRARPGRVVFTAPRNGRRIPESTFITVRFTPWIEGLITRHGDIEFRQPTNESQPAASEYRQPLMPAPEVQGAPPDLASDSEAPRKVRRQRAGNSK